MVGDLEMKTEEIYKREMLKLLNKKHFPLNQDERERIRAILKDDNRGKRNAE